MRAEQMIAAKADSSIKNLGSGMRQKVSPGWRGYAEGINKRNEIGDAREKRVEVLKTRQESRPLCKQTYHMSTWISIFKVKAKKIKNNSVLSWVPLKVELKTNFQGHTVYLGR